MESSFTAPHTNELDALNYSIFVASRGSKKNHALGIFWNVNGIGMLATTTNNECKKTDKDITTTRYFYNYNESVNQTKYQSVCVAHVCNCTESDSNNESPLKISQALASAKCLTNER